MEENSFLQTLEQGTDLLNQKIDAMRKAGSTVLNGEDAFQLYDTFGFPWELTEEILGIAGTTNLLALAKLYGVAAEELLRGIDRSEE